MHNTSNNNTTTIRFRRWSRGGYAVFSSLSSNITIGRLVVSVSDKSLLKSVAAGSISFSDLNTRFVYDNTDSEINELEALFQLNQLEVNSISIFDNAIACAVNSSYLFNHYSG